MEQVVILHISDLHFGSSPVEPRSLRSRARKAAGRGPHDFLRCEPLYQVLDQARSEAEMAEGEPLHVIVSGDLTSGGSPGEFLLVNKFLHSRYTLPDSDPADPVFFGLSIARDDAFLSIAGNHDHAADGGWLPPFPPVRAFNDSVYGDGYFEVCPVSRTWTSAGGKLVVEVFGIDSASGLTQSTNYLANGRFSQVDLLRLKALLDDSDRERPNEAEHVVRIIVSHHPLAHKGAEHTSADFVVDYSNVFATNRLDDDSYSRLLELAVKYRVSAILSGHVHRFGNVKLPRRRNGAVLNLACDYVPELTCSTTLQNPSKGAEIGLWLHRIQATGADLSWRPQKFVWDGTNFQAGLLEPSLRLRSA